MSYFKTPNSYMGVLIFSQILKVLQLQDYRYSIEIFNFITYFFQSAKLWKYFNTSDRMT